MANLGPCHTHNPSLFQSSSLAELSVGTNASRRTVCQGTRTGNRQPRHAKNRQLGRITSAPSTNNTVASNLAVRHSGWTTKKKAHVLHAPDSEAEVRQKRVGQRCAQRWCRVVQHGMRKCSMPSRGQRNVAMTLSILHNVAVVWRLHLLRVPPHLRKHRIPLKHMHHESRQPRCDPLVSVLSHITTEPHKLLDHESSSRAKRTTST